MSILEKLGKERLYFDGGYGTLFQERGLKAGQLPEMWNIEQRQEVINIHKEYLESGCDIITANTFGANILKYDGKDGRPTLKEIIKAAIENAKEAVRGFSGEKYVALDIGPTGKLLKPLGDLDFEDAIDIFSETVKLGVKFGADLIIIETMNDSYETKAAVLAAKENSNLPVFVTNTYDESGKLMTGANVPAMIALLEGLRVDALGINCGFGPDKMGFLVDQFIKHSSIPIIVNPNAGLPKVKDGKTIFDITPSEFAKNMEEIAKKGVMILGGCCGTTPSHIKELVKRTESISLNPPVEKEETIVSSYTHAVKFDERPVLIGERINPTGKPLFKTALKEENYDYILKEGVSQEEKGVDILDVNVGLPEIDEVKVLEKTVKMLQSVTPLPLQIDTASHEAMEKALRVYNGKALINSVNGKKEVMEEIFPLAAKYGGVVIGLTLDENGIPKTAEERVLIAEKIIETAKNYGIDKKDIIIDPLAMTVSADSTSAKTTLKAIEILSKKGIKTSLGVSNVSFGLPRRELINSTFFAMALTKGLSAAIMNPHSEEMMTTYKSFCALADEDENCRNYIDYVSSKEERITESKEEVSPIDGLKRAIIKGLLEDAARFARKLLKEIPPIKIINDAIIPALDFVGKSFEDKKTYLPQLLMSAEAAKEAFLELKKSLEKEGGNDENEPKIVIATVKGDIHDIGKNIVKVLLNNYDFTVYDLGKDVSPEEIVKKVKEEKVKLVGLSALMTTTVPSMAKTIELLRKEAKDVKVMVGGAVITEEYAKMIGADKYAKDAMEAVRYAEEVLR